MPIRINSELLVPTIEMWKTGVQHGDWSGSQRVMEWVPGSARICMVQGKTDSFLEGLFHIEEFSLDINVASNLEFQAGCHWGISRIVSKLSIGNVLSELWCSCEVCDKVNKCMQMQGHTPDEL